MNARKLLIVSIGNLSNNLANQLSPKVNHINIIPINNESDEFEIFLSDSYEKMPATEDNFISSIQTFKQLLFVVYLDRMDQTNLLKQYAHLSQNRDKRVILLLYLSSDLKQNEKDVLLPKIRNLYSQSILFDQNRLTLMDNDLYPQHNDELSKKNFYALLVAVRSILESESCLCISENDMMNFFYPHAQKLYFGFGSGYGINRCHQAIHEAISSPLFKDKFHTIMNFDTLLMVLRSSSEISFTEVQKSTILLGEIVGGVCDIKFTFSRDESLSEKVEIYIIGLTQFKEMESHNLSQNQIMTHHTNQYSYHETHQKIITKNHFDHSPTIIDGNNLDIPTFIRKIKN